MKVFWGYLALLTSVASDPLMLYSFCPLSNPRCEPTTFASDSSLEFGNITSGVIFYELGEWTLPSLSCAFHEPLRWILTTPGDTLIDSFSSNVTMNGSHPIYYYHIQFSEAIPGLVRCESYANPDLAAEVFIAQRNPSHNYFQVDHKLLRFLPTTTLRRGGHFIVPCAMFRFDHNFDASTMRLKKLKKSDIIARAITRECISCFPSPDEHVEVNCTTSCPYGISHRVWNDAGKLIGVNKTGNQWLDCVRDPECALKTVTKASQSVSSDCNHDSEITCSDHFSALTSYPADCQSGSISISLTNFRAIEACIVKNIAQLLNSTEADYDPRVGFRVKTEKDMDAVYFCPEPGVYYSIYNPSQKLHVRLEAVDNAKSDALVGVFCTVPQKWMENVNMEFLPCSTLHECELQLQVLEAFTFLRRTDYIVHGKPISEVSNRLYGRIITNPPRSGVVHCKASYTIDVGYIWNQQFFFIGLDSKSYFLSSNPPIEALISVQKVQTDMKVTRNEFEIQVECTVATFIIFPTFEFLVEYSNGTIISKTEQILGLQQESHSASQRLTEPVNDDVSVIVSIRCRAPFRNSKNHVESTLVIGSDRKSPSLQSDGHITQVYYLVAILTGTSIVLVLCAVTCAVYAVRKYKKSRELRQLTLDEVNEFLNGNAAIATESDTEVNVDGIGFPECYQIPPMDLKMRTQEVLGEGEFGRCVRGDLRGQEVAVKTTKALMDVDSFKEFLREVKMMAYLGKHEHIVEFLGAVVNQLRDRICIAAVELSPYGDLLSYLRRNDMENPNPNNVNLYANLSHGELLEGSQGSKFGIRRLSYFCEQIASAMEFVVEKRVIHGDLAARNVLVFPDNVVKITDFGLSRKLYTASNYKKKNMTPLPWRWMAIESLKYMEFSPMTDMWAYGVTAWEIFSLGQVPYAGLVYSVEFVDELDRGLRLQRPRNASGETYQFMNLTWNRIPSARPSFKDAKFFFRRLSTGNQ